MHSRYKITPQTLLKILNELGSPEAYELEFSRRAYVQGQLSDLGKPYEFQVTRNIGYTATVSLDEHWDKSWDIILCMPDDTDGNDQNEAKTEQGENVSPAKGSLN